MYIESSKYIVQLAHFLTFPSLTCSMHLTKGSYYILKPCKEHSKPHLCSHFRRYQFNFD